MTGKTLVIQYVTRGKGLKPDAHVKHNKKSGGCDVTEHQEGPLVVLYLYCFSIGTRAELINYP
jgi:hypothetical protein